MTTDPNSISTLDTTTINSAVSAMTDTELCNIMSSITKDVEIDTLIKCDRESLDKIYRVKRENVEELIKRDTDEDTHRVVECITEFSEKENPTFYDFMKVCEEMTWMVSELKKDNERCEKDITDLELAYEKLRENFFMYEEDLCEESVKVCKEKMDYTEGLIRLRYKTLETNTQSIKGLEHIVQSMTSESSVD